MTESSEYYIKECYERCVALYPSTDSNFSYCLIGCSIGGQKLKEKDVTRKPVDGARQARDSYSDCLDSCKEQHWNIALVTICIIRCNFRRKLEDTPTKLELLKKVPVAEDCNKESLGDWPYYGECTDKCLETYSEEIPKTDFWGSKCVKKCIDDADASPTRPLKDDFRKLEVTPLNKAVISDPPSRPVPVFSLTPEVADK